MIPTLRVDYNFLPVPSCYRWCIHVAASFCGARICADLGRNGPGGLRIAAAVSQLGFVDFDSFHPTHRVCGGDRFDLKQHDYVGQFTGLDGQLIRVRCRYAVEHILCDHRAEHRAGFGHGVADERNHGSDGYIRPFEHGPKRRTPCQRPRLQRGFRDLRHRGRSLPGLHRVNRQRLGGHVRS